MIVYHGSTVIVGKPQIIIAEYGRDFGTGFGQRIEGRGVNYFNWKY
jgi:hypothetical protein